MGGTGSERPQVPAGGDRTATQVSSGAPEVPVAADTFTAEQARWVRGCLSRDVRRESKIGKVPPRFAAGVFDLLDRLSETTTHPMPDNGTPFARIGMDEGPCWISVEESTRVTGLSDSYLRRLCRAGRVRTIRVGKRAYLIDPDSLPRRKQK